MEGRVSGAVLKVQNQLVAVEAQSVGRLGPYCYADGGRRVGFMAPARQTSSVGLRGHFVQGTDQRAWRGAEGGEVARATPSLLPLLLTHVQHVGTCRVSTPITHSPGWVQSERPV